MKFAIAVLVTMSFAVTATEAQEQGAPFGLEWLSTSEQVADLGVNLAPIELATFGESFVATNLPKALSDIETVVLSFGYTDQLWRVAALSTEFENDKYGFSGKERYDQIAQSLAKSYRLEDTFERASSDSYYGRSEKFAYSLSEDEAFWYSLYSSDVSDIELSLDSNYEDTFWRLIYSHKAGEAAFEQGKSDVELDAL